MMARLLNWIASRNQADHTGAEALAEAERRLADEGLRTEAAREVGQRAKDSRTRNNYAAALRAAYNGRPS